MFSLIITIISIALVAALAVASVYYGGEAWSRGSARANADTIINNMNQIAAAITLYRVEFPMATLSEEMDELVTEGYLAALPSIPAALWVEPDDPSDDDNKYLYESGFTTILYAAIASGEVCLEINRTVGVDAVSTADAESWFAANSAPYQCLSQGGAYRVYWNPDAI